MSRYMLLLSICAVAVSAHAQAPATPAPQPIAAAPVPAPNPNSLVFDSESKEYKAKPGEANAPFTFYATNVSSEPIQITALRPSCGCTAAQLPSMPYSLGGGSNVPITVSMNLAGKMGLVTKSLGVESSVGFKSLILRIDIPQATSPAPAPIANAATPANAMGDRAKNIQIALNDRQAVFKGDCRSCHVDKGVGKVGKELYDADCGICHDDVHRAAMVPDLKLPRTQRDLQFWRTWIADGKAGTMMPAFHASQGGPLTQEQVDSLAAYLFQTLPKDPPATAAAKPALPAPPTPPTALAPQRN